MSRKATRHPGKFASIGACLLLPSMAFAQDSNDALAQELTKLKAQVEQLQEAVDNARQTTQSQDAAIRDAAEWKHSKSLVHLAGYASAGYTKSEGQDGSFNTGTFNPIFHFNYKDVVMFESEMELKYLEDGSTELNLEYMSLDYFVNDYMIFIAGKFLSPIGQFRQNLHPAWINKLPSVPMGYGHDGAAPLSEMGLQLRGVLPIDVMRTSYAFYVSNGPEMNAVFEDGEYELEGIVAEGLNFDRDGGKVVGGRLGFFPLQGLEVGVSAATGKVTVTNLVDEEVGTAEPLADEALRDYDVLGADFTYLYNNFSLRGEFIRSTIGEATTGTTASGGAEWQSWYTQASYRLPRSPFEGVLRYTDSTSPHAMESQEQVAVGANYWLTDSFVAKAAYEFNEGETGSAMDANRFLLQLAYGF